MDAYILHKAFEMYLRDDEPSNDWEPTENNVHEKNIRFYMLQLHEEKSRFIGCYSHIRRILTPRLEKLCRWICVPELGGTIEVKEPDYDKIHEELISCYERCERIYSFIQDTEKQIANEYQLWEADRNAEALKRFRYRNWLPERINAPKCIGVQLELFTI